MKKTNNKNELLGMIYRYIYRRRGLTALERELILQGAKYVIKHLPKDDKRTM